MPQSQRHLQKTSNTKAAKSKRNRNQAKTFHGPERIQKDVCQKEV